MYSRLPLALFLMAFFALFATVIFAEDVPSEDVCQGSTGGIDHLIYHENGELIFFASAVLEKTEDWVKYPCAPESNSINKFFEKAKDKYLSDELSPLAYRCVFTQREVYHRGVDRRLLESEAREGGYSNLFAVEVDQVIQGFSVPENRKYLLPGRYVSVRPIESVKGQTPPSFFIVPDVPQKVHGINFCFGPRVIWSKDYRLVEGDQFFVLLNDTEELLPYHDTPAFVLRDGVFRGSSAFLKMRDSENPAILPTTADAAVTFLEFFIGGAQQ